MSNNGQLTICQISDIHCGNARFVPELLDRTIIEINDLNPTAVVVSGDLTDAGYREEFEMAADYIDRIRCEHVMVIPGNHDARNVGYIHLDRKSTRLNSSHANISYAVFCLKKKKHSPICIRTAVP